jgi:hypothetical protein
MSGDLSAVEKFVEDILIDLMAEKVISKGFQASSMIGVKESPSNAHGSGPSRTATKKKTKHHDDLENVDVIYLTRRMSYRGHFFQL